MWERRYGFPRPERTPGGNRAYSKADVESLRLIRRALEQGYRPSEVVGKAREELARLIDSTTESQLHVDPTEPTLASILASLARDDLAALRAELRRASMLLGPKRFLIDIAHPLAVRVGELWSDGKLEVRHEHMLTECLSAQLRSLMSAYEDRPGAPQILLATLPSERHGLGLEMVQVYLASGQVTPVLLGVDTPPEQIVKTARRQGVDAIGLLVTRSADIKLTAKYVRWMLAELPRRVALWIGGTGGPDLQTRHDAVRIVTTWGDLDEAMETLERRSTK